jgi:hypothetical protein
MRGLLLKRSLLALTLHLRKIFIYYNVNCAVFPYNLTPNSDNKVLKEAGINLKVKLRL